MVSSCDFQNKRIERKMAPEFFKREANLFIVEGRFCFNATDQVLHSQNVMEIRSPHNEIGGRISLVGMGGIVNLTSII